MSTITQLSIFINNEPGAIANISKTLKEFIEQAGFMNF